MRKSNGKLTLFIKRHQTIINIIEPISKIVSRFGTFVHPLRSKQRPVSLTEFTGRVKGPVE